MDIGPEISPNGVVKPEIKRGRGRPPKVAPAPAPARFRLEHIPCAINVADNWKLANVWEFVKAGCEEVIKKSAITSGFDTVPGKDGKPTQIPHIVDYFYKWKPEDIYLALRMNKATLYMAHMDGKLKGFGIIQVQNDTFGNTPPYVLSWCGYCSDRETRIAYYRELETVAKSFKLHEIRHASTRKGWLVDPPTPDWETLTSQGWIKNLTREQIHQLWLAPEIIQRRIVD